MPFFKEENRNKKTKDISSNPKPNADLSYKSKQYLKEWKIKYSRKNMVAESFTECTEFCKEGRATINKSGVFPSSRKLSPSATRYTMVVEC